MGKIKQKDLVSIHACERYIERIMGIPVNEGSLSLDKIGKMTELLLRIAKEAHPACFTLNNGHFNCKDYDCVLVLKAGVIVTVKELKKETQPEFNGGILKSGSKIKKLLVHKRPKEKYDGYS